MESLEVNFLNSTDSWSVLCRWVSKVLFVQVAVIHLLQNQHFRHPVRPCAAH